MRTRRAILPDAPSIERLISSHVGDGTLLARSLAEICENIRDFVVVEDGGEIVGCGALHLYGMHLAEIRSINVLPEYRKHGAGRAVIDALMAEARHQQVSCVCLFTRIPEYFGKLGFRQVPRESLPDKAYKDCLTCPRRYACDEVAMVMGEVPDFAILAPTHSTALKIFGVTH